MKKEIICKKILQFMANHCITLDDLQLYDESLQITGKFPLAVYYSDHTQSFEIKHASADKNRIPIGVVIKDTLYSFPNFKGTVDQSQVEDYCDDIIDYKLKGIVPSKEQLETLTRNLSKYNSISTFFFNTKLEKIPLAISDKVGAVYNMKSKEIEICTGFRFVLPVVNL